MKKAKVSSVRRLGAARHIFQKGGKLEGTELQAADEGPQCGDGSALWSPAEQVIQQKKPASKAPESNTRICLTPRAVITKVTPGHTENKQGRTQIARQVHPWHCPFCPGLSWQSPLPLICQLSVFSGRGRSRGQSFDVCMMCSDATSPKRKGA